MERQPRHETRPSTGVPWEPICWVNGLPVDPRRPALSVSERGFSLGDGCFETMRAYEGVIFRLDQHLARLARAADAMGIPVPPHLDETLSDAERALRSLRANAAVRLTLTRGVGPGVAPPPDAEPTTVLFVGPVPPFPASLRSGGLAVGLATGRRNELAPTAGLKTLAFADAVIALGQARAAGADDALFLDTAGHLSEGTSSNIFLVFRGIVHTPPLSCGALPGITRGAVLDILAGFDIPVDESPIPGDALPHAAELFLTSSLREIAAVASVDGQPVGTGVPGPITRRIQTAYRELVAATVADALSAVVA
jgi:branched-chain amino acid aminotransferase